MREFVVLIGELLFIVLIQSILESVLDAEKRERYMKVINVACVVVSYVMLIRYVHNNLWAELQALVGVIL